ncbi:P-loop containing nucleoside triphosphate hydrolase protein [Neocallimastix californiae]|uniref:RNA helicase n=1 Tax=Neocallimastix californiae TaxID=1754190 RepID=A0A1Y2ELU8_9FUNG|nr:P-loop containing nucleoside triphosphate hydrolase protein [Neocallimastix californiae]|eukprot:ORY72479.1 P-loop containing nucleoside triphosphate hydrolase protein [Neocallimastix californiae]
MECKKIDIQNSKNSIEESSYSTPTNLFNSDKPIEITLGLENITFPIQKILFDSDLLINSINFEDFMKKKPFDIKIPEELEIPNPIQKFESLNLNSQLFQNLKKNRYHKPTLVQMLSIPLLLTGNDMLVKSPTKSGKTLSYLLPLIIHCINMAQCFIDLEDISSNFNSKINNSIDEIDQIINYGEEETIRNILDRLKTLNRSNHYKQTIVASDENNYIQINKSKKSANNLIHSIQVSLFSSTIPPKIVPICRKFLNSSYITLSPVKQTFLWVEDNSKKKELFKLLMDSRYFQPLIIIFVDSRLGAELLTKAIQKKTGLGVACVHGQKSVEERKKILEQFKLGGSYPIIVSTSGILGRGVQLENVRMVIQFDCASTVEEYMHQVGRCAMLINSTMSSSSSTKSSSSSSFQMTRKVASLYFPKGNKHFRTGHPWLGGTGGWAITFINKSNQPVFQKLYHQYLKNLSSSELTPLPQQLLNQVKKL